MRGKTRWIAIAAAAAIALIVAVSVLGGDDEGGLDVVDTTTTTTVADTSTTVPPASTTTRPRTTVPPPPAGQAQSWPEFVDEVGRSAAIVCAVEGTSQWADDHEDIRLLVEELSSEPELVGFGSNDYFDLYSTSLLLHRSVVADLVAEADDELRLVLDDDYLAAVDDLIAAFIEVEDDASDGEADIRPAQAATEAWWGAWKNEFNCPFSHFSGANPVGNRIQRYSYDPADGGFDRPAAVRCVAATTVRVALADAVERGETASVGGRVGQAFDVYLAYWPDRERDPVAVELANRWRDRQVSDGALLTSDDTAIAASVLAEFEEYRRSEPEGAGSLCPSDPGFEP